MTELDSRASWLRLAISVTLGTIGSVGFWSYVVALPAVQADFGVTRADAALPYTLTMVGFAFGGVAMGWLADRFGIFTPLAIGAVLLALGYVGAAMCGTFWLLALVQGCAIGGGAAAYLSPLLADISHWFHRRRGLAVAICASGNYIGGALWPPIIQHFIEAAGWRATYLGVGIFCFAAIVPLALALRGPAAARQSPLAASTGGRGGLAVAPGPLLALLCVAGVACCVAMAMPQVHLVAYCADLGYGPARGAEMLSLMLALGIVSRVGSGVLADRTGGLATLLIGSFAQGVALFLYLSFDGLASLFVISALFGLFQGGIVPMYTIIVREYFPAEKAGAMVGVVMMATLVGMALGGWMSGLVFDLTGSYQMAFLNGLAWNLVNVAVVAYLMIRRRPAGGLDFAPGASVG